MGEAWLRGVRGRGWLGLCRQELKEGWQERGSGSELPAWVVVEGSWKQSRGPAIPEEAAVAFSQGGRGFPVAEHQPEGRVGADAVRTCPPAAWERRCRERTVSLVPPRLGLRDRPCRLFRSRGRWAREPRDAVLNRTGDSSRSYMTKLTCASFAPVRACVHPPSSCTLWAV